MYSGIATTHEYIRFFEQQLSNFGSVSRGNKKYVFRKNVNNPFPDKTSFSDFVFGIIPDVNVGDLRYSAREGVFVKAIKEATQPESRSK